MTGSQEPSARRPTVQRTVLVIVTLTLAGRAMTLAFIADAGSGATAAPPAAWLMPLIGDAVIGVSALGAAYLILRGHGPGAWTALVAWNVVGIWDAMAAFVVHQSVPWPEFFMIEVFGSSMFFAAGAMHLLNLWLMTRTGLRAQFGTASRHQHRAA